MGWTIGWTIGWTDSGSATIRFSISPMRKETMNKENIFVVVFIFSQTDSHFDVCTDLLTDRQDTAKWNPGQLIFLVTQ